MDAKTGSIEGCPVPHGGGEIGVGRGNYAHINLARPLFAQRLNLTFL